MLQVASLVGRSVDWLAKIALNPDAGIFTGGQNWSYQFECPAKRQTVGVGLRSVI